MPKTAAVPPASALKLLAISRASTRTNGSSPATLPMSSTADPAKASWARMNAAMTHSQSAPMIVSNDCVTSMSTPISAQPPISVPTIRIRFVQLIRRGSASLGSSIDLALAACSRTWSSSFL